jgi:hypothetical protein
LSKRPPSPIPPLLIAIAFVVAMAVFWMRRDHGEGADADNSAQTPRAARAVPRPAAPPASAAGRDEEGILKMDTGFPAGAFPEVRGRVGKIISQRDARPGEIIIIFKTARAMHEFVARAPSAGAYVIASVGQLFAVRARCLSLDALTDDMLKNARDLELVGGNHLVEIPEPPPADRADRAHHAVGGALLAAIGVNGGADNSAWGRGVTIAVLDNAVMPDATFAPDRLRILDIGWGAAPGSGARRGHGTSVAALAAGSAPGARGVAPMARVLGIRVVDEEGFGDIFTIAKGIADAVDEGADIINISLGRRAGDIVTRRAIDYATEHGAVLVAAAGNEQSTELSWPAAEPRVISVGAVDASGIVARFSNSGPQLQITAPGVAIDSAGADGGRAPFSGTSASAPIVAGALAALMSETPGLTAPQAWEILRTHAGDAGEPGHDPDYGHGVLNLGWAMARNDTARADMAVTAHLHDRARRAVTIVVQNRGGFGIAGAVLDTELDGASSKQVFPWIDPGAVATSTLPLPAGLSAAAAGAILRTTLALPAGLVDSVPENNHRSSRLAP